MRKWKAPALLLAVMLLLTGCAPKDAGLAVLVGLSKTELEQGDLPCRSYYAGETLMVPLCKVADDFYIGAFIMFGDAEVTVACAKELLARAPKEYDYLLTAEAKSIPLIHEMARQSGASEYFVARKGMKVYLTNPIHVQVRSITTQHDQDLYLSGEDAAKMKGKKILIVDDVISTGESLHALEELVKQAGGEVAGRMAVLAEGDAQKRDDIVYLEKLPVFNADGTVKY